MSRVSFRHVKKQYPGENRLSVEDFHLEVEDGEFLVLVGPSGCGKSTLLRMLAGLEEITDGEIYIGDALVNYVSSKDRNIAMVFQNYALYPHMSVYENIAFGLRLRKLPKADIHERVTRAAKVLDIEAHLKKLPKQMSGGQRQRVALGRAIVREPEVFLMDEPLSNLDAKLRVQMREELTKLHRKLKTTTIYVTHDQIEAMTMGTRIVVMKQGEIQQIGTPKEIYVRPSNRFVAGFIGSPPMNFVDGRLKTHEGELFFDTKRYSLPVSAKQRQVLLEKPALLRRITLGIRAEHTRCHPVGQVPEGACGSHYIAKIEYSEFMGSDTFFHVHNTEHKMVVRVDPHERIGSEGEEVAVSVDMNRAIFFDPESGDFIC